MRGGIYARISEDRDETQLGVQRQIRDCEELAARRGWDIIDRYIDNDVSAYSGKRRPEYRRMLTDIASGRIEAIVVYHHDRLHRQPRELEEFFDVCDRAGVKTMATVSGDIDLGTDDGRFHARIMGAVARKSSDDQSRRLKRKALELAERGLPTGGGDRPFGFENDRVTIRPDEAAVVRELAERLLAGEALRGLCVDLNRRQIRTTRGGEWKTQTLRRMIASGRISGQREHHRQIVGPATWDAIITPEQTARIRALLADPSRRATRPARSYLLKGLVRCGRCDTPLISRPRDDGQRRYVCATGPGFAGCGATYVLAEPVEIFVTEAVLSRLDSPELGRAVRGVQRETGDAWQERADQLAGRLDELAGAYAGEAISMREWLAAREPLQTELTDARRRIARTGAIAVLAEHVGRGGDLRERWDTLTIDQRRAIISAVLYRVTVKPGRRGYNRFDPARFELTWRH